MNAFEIRARNLGLDDVRTCGDAQLVVFQGLTGGEDDDFRQTIDVSNLRVKLVVDICTLEEVC